MFLEPSLAGQARDLKQIAENLGIRVCTIRGDAFDPEVGDYEELMRANARNFTECLGAGAEPAKGSSQGRRSSAGAAPTTAKNQT